MNRSILASAALTFVFAGAAWAQKDQDVSSRDLAEIADRLAPSLVRVEYTVQYDRGELPGGGFRGGEGWENWEELIKQERPMERGGFLIAPDLVYTTDPMIHPRFIQSIQVRSGASPDVVVSASPAAFPHDEYGWLLKLERPLSGRAGSPLEFTPDAEGPYFGVTHLRQDGFWTTRIGGVRSWVTVSEDGRRTAQASAATLIVDGSGTPVGLTGTGQLAIPPRAETWRGSPESWPALAGSDMEQVLARVEQVAAETIVRVEVNFRSPRSRGETDGFWGMARYSHPGAGDDEETATEWNGLGVLMDERTLLVLANFRPKNTARLERVRAYLPDGRTVTASFAGTLRDWGCFLADLEEPVATPFRASSREIHELRNRLLIKGQIGVRGESRIAYFWRDRITGFTLGHKGQLYPGGHGAEPRSWSPGGLADTNFLFEPDGALVTIPLERRERITSDAMNRRWYGSSASLLAVPTGIIRDLLSDRHAHIDSENRPLSEEEENRLAWLGVELQGMNPELARVNNVVEQTRNGQSGAMVTFIYANSPAADAGLEPGDILLRLHIEGQPRPLEITLQDHGFGGMFDHFWTMIDEMPIEYMEHMPAPWGSVENTLTRALTDLGFGTPFVAEVFRNGDVIQIPFEVAAGPSHYEAAARFNSEEAGLTVRDLTYEVRRYFQIPDDEPGIVISRIENGGRASVAGLRPFELILAVDDRPIRSVQEFKEAIAPGGEFRMSIKRMTTGRIVKMRVDPRSE